MSSTVCILGRQPELGIAELESLFGADAVTPLGDQAVLVDNDPSDINFARLGGTVKFCKLLTYLDTTNWDDIETFLIQAVPEHAAALPDGKLRLGLSAYNLKVSPRRIHATGLQVKKMLRQSGRSTRTVPNTELALSSAQVLHNQLTQQLGWELLFIRTGTRTVVAQTIAVQDIYAYAKRDQERPKRDARVGMLPPKLAQIIVNLAVGPADPKLGSVVLDPFCGTGVVLQEASLMGFDICGTDLEPRMVDYTKANLDWLLKHYQTPGCGPDDVAKVAPQNEAQTFYRLEVGDATSHSWSPAPQFVAAETYLGRPFSSQPQPDVLSKVIQDVDTIHTKFLQNAAKQFSAGTRLCLAVPAWKQKNGFLHLPCLDHLEKMGYTRVSFARSGELVYHRPGQYVGRELIVITRK